MDRSVWNFDEADYAIHTLTLWHTLADSLEDWYSLMITISRSKAPGLMWFGQWFVPLGKTAGRIEIGLLASILLSQIASLILIYRTASNLFYDNRVAPIIAVIFAASTPVFVDFTHCYRVEPMQILAASYFWWIASVSDKKNPTVIMIHGTYALCLSMMSKVLWPLFSWAPVLIILFNVWKRRQQFAVKSLLPSIQFWLTVTGAVVFLMFTIVWYVVNIDSLFRFAAYAAAYGRVSPYYDQNASYLIKLARWLGLLQQIFFLRPIFYLVMPLGAVALVLSHQGLRKSIESKHLLFAASALFTLLSVVMVFSLNVTEKGRYAAPLLPAAALIISILFAYTLRHLCYLAVAIFVCQACLCNVEAFGATILHQKPLRSFFKNSYHLRRIANEQTLEAELQRVLKLTTASGANNTVVFCGVAYPWLSVYNLKLIFVKNSKPDFRVWFDHMCSRFEGRLPWRRNLKSESLYFVSVSPEFQTRLNQKLPRINKRNLSILESVQANKDFRRIPFDSSRGILIYHYEGEWQNYPFCHATTD